MTRLRALPPTQRQQVERWLGCSCCECLAVHIPINLQGLTLPSLILPSRGDGRLLVIPLLALEPVAREFERAAVLRDRPDDIVRDTSGDVRVDLQRHSYR